MTTSLMLMKKFIYLISLSLCLSSIPAFAATIPKAGATCSKQGLTIKEFTCKKVKGKLIWASNLPMQDQINLNLPNNWYISQGLFYISPTTKSGKVLKVSSDTKSICDISDLSINPISPGRCILRIETSADKSFQAKMQLFSLDIRDSNDFENNVASQYYFDEVGPELVELSSAGLPIEYNVKTPIVCKVNGIKIEFLIPGDCAISGIQRGSAFIDQSVVKEIKLKVMKKNVISFAQPESINLSVKTYQLSAISSSGLKVYYTSNSPDVCTLSENVLTLLKHGYCVVEVSQSGDIYTVPASVVTGRIKIMRENIISMVLPSNVSLKLKNLQLTGITSSGLQVTYKSLTPNTCTVSNSSLSLQAVGTCNIITSQPGDEFTPPAQDLLTSILISNDRVLADQPDSLTGYQIKAIYVVPSDGTDRGYDTTGYITSILREGNAFLKSSIGLEYQVDSIGSDFDIQFFKSSYSTSYFLSGEDLAKDLAKEMKLYENATLDRKNYMFFIDVPTLRNGAACGYAPMPGLLSVIAVGPVSVGTLSCMAKSLNFENYASLAWVHESFHNLGVDHTVNDSCDLMRGSGDCKSVWTIDKDKNKYVGAATQGVNILTLRVWKGYTTDQNLRASCNVQNELITRSDGLRYALCPIGSQFIGALTYCWNINSGFELQIWKNNNWESLGEGKIAGEPWGKFVNWKCPVGSTAPWMELTVTSPGIQKYRWMINNSEGEVFNVIWQR